ncbi:probable cysteine desulfurase [Salvia hispanica]|uniref:probable cysteine desulfurase n=1 Tax=Salvia hispanica TaxID=49212 RepID=UPI00200901A8|nr:probable cysteine desulfurase [Salvia hispanica]
MTMQMKFELHHLAPIYETSLNDDQDITNFMNDALDHHHCDDIVSHENIPFHVVGRGVPKTNDSTKKKVSWLRSQIIGATAEFKTPFGRRHLTYADHTASGRPLHYIENYVTTKLLPFYGNTHTSDSYVGYHTTKMVLNAKSYVKRCLGGGEEDAIIFCGSGSTAAIKRLQEVMGIAVPSILRESVLKCLSDKERWVVFVGPYEHHSNLLSWRQSLAEVVEIALDRHGHIDMEALANNLSLYKNQNRQMLGSFSACSNVTGIVTDTRAIACLLHQYGAFACFDFAASGPYTKIDMRSSKTDGYDAIFLSPHKFLGGPGTPGILLMSKILYRLGSSPPSTCGGGTVDFVNNLSEQDTLYLDDIEEREDAGTPQNIQKVRAGLAFWIKEFIGYKAIEMLEKTHIEKAVQRLIRNPNIVILGNTHVKRQAILSFLIHSSSPSKSRGKPLNGSFVAKLLNDLFGIQARGGCTCAGSYAHTLLNLEEHHSLAMRSFIKEGYVGIKPGWTRVSFPYYMSEEEVDFILGAIEFIAMYGQRFLSCYHINWTKGTWTFKKNSHKDQYSSSLARMIMALNTEHNVKQDVALRYKNYMETAKKVASLLPKFPPHRETPQEIDMNLVPFRV